MNCRICSATTAVFDQAMVLQRHMVTYYRCPSCGFIQTEDPYWLDESYTEPLTDSDVGMVQRNLQLASVSKVVIDVFFTASGKFVDYGGGYGLLTRLMRDKGYDFYCYDKHCPPLFARQFPAEPGEGRSYELATACEVVEHFADPLREFEELLAMAPNLLFATELVPPNLTRLHDWWYVAPEHGQHVAFYTPTALAPFRQAVHFQWSQHSPI